MRQALVKLFPEIGLKKESFKQKRVTSTYLLFTMGNLFLYILENYWKSTENQRKFFIELASQNGFDPLVPKNWDKITKKHITKKV